MVQMNIKYRPEIDGLRALAVLPVIVFHASKDYFPQGFLGVDIFFCISGFLITSIIMADLAKASFSFARFYERRVRRILPALFLVIFCSIPLACLTILSAGELDTFINSLVASLLFLTQCRLSTFFAYLVTGGGRTVLPFLPLYFNFFGKMAKTRANHIAWHSHPCQPVGQHNCRDVSSANGLLHVAHTVLAIESWCAGGYCRLESWGLAHPHSQYSFPCGGGNNICIRFFSQQLGAHKWSTGCFRDCVHPRLCPAGNDYCQSPLSQANRWHWSC